MSEINCLSRREVSHQDALLGVCVYIANQVAPIVQVHNTPVDAASHAELARLRELQLMSWSNVCDYMAPCKYQLLATACTAAALAVT